MLGGLPSRGVAGKEVEIAVSDSGSLGGVEILATVGVHCSVGVETASDEEVPTVLLAGAFVVGRGEETRNVGTVDSFDGG